MDREMLKEELLGILNKVLAFRAAMEGSDSSTPAPTPTNEGGDSAAMGSMVENGGTNPK